MEIMLEAPIDADDVRLLEDRRDVALSVEKFGELVHYVEHLEGTLKCVDVEFKQERRYAGFLMQALSELIDKVESVGYGHLCSEMAYSWGDQIERLYRQGDIRKESADAGQAIMSKLTGKVADAERGASC